MTKHIRMRWSKEKYCCAAKRSILVLLLIISCLFISKKGVYVKIVVSGSMEPKFLVGSVCVIEKNYPVDGVKVGDIIAFSVDEHTLVTHRIIRIPKEGYFVTKGDANESPDIRWTKKSEYKGKVIGNIPYIGYVCIFLFQQKKIVWIVLAILLWREIERRKYIENKKRQKMDDDSGHLCVDAHRREHN